jgi:hypothetical protein
MHIILIGLAMLAAVASFFWFQQNGRRRINTTQNEAYQKLLRKAMGDRTQTERLIEFERQRNPRASRGRLIRAALERWERDLS